MIRTTMYRLFLLFLFVIPPASASELEPVIFVTTDVKKNGDLADAQAEATREQKEAAKKMAKAAADENAATTGSPPTEKDAAAQKAAAQQREQAARELEQAIAKADAAAQAVANATHQAENFAWILASAIKQELSCARVIREPELADFYDQQREKAVRAAGGDVDPLEEKGKEEPEAEYLVQVVATPKVDGGYAGPLLLEASCKHKRTKTVLASVSTSNVGGGDSLVGLAELFVDQMVKFEVCPYLGKVSVLVDLAKDNQTKTERAVYCNKRDGKFLRNDNEVSSSKQQWELEKTGRRSATGDLEYSGSEKFDVSEEDDCHRCTPEYEGRRTYTKNTTTDISVTGLSDDSTGKKGDTVNKDARIRIRFLEDGVYFIKIDATSRNGTALVTVKENATGPCDTINHNPPPEKKVRDVPLEAVEWGPFSGSPKDKRLADTKDDPLNKPEIKETGKQTIKFELSRE